MTTTDRGPGRPDIGPLVKSNLPGDLVAWLEDQAQQRGTTRAGLIRDLLLEARDAGVPAPRRP